MSCKAFQKYPLPAKLGANPDENTDFIIRSSAIYAHCFISHFIFLYQTLKELGWTTAKFPEISKTQNCV